MALRSTEIVDGKSVQLEAGYLVSACLIAMVAVFALLGALALVIEIMTRVFPVRRYGIDATVAATISTAVAAAIPGAVVTRIEEKP